MLDGAEEVVPLALMALGLDPNTSDQNDFNQVADFLLSDPQGRHHHQLVRLHQRRDRRQDHPRPGLERRRPPDRRRGARRRATSRAVIPTEASEIWADNWCIPADAPHPVAAHAWINWLLTPSTAVTEMNYHNYPIPIPSALAQMPADLRNDPLFNVPADVHRQLQVHPEREPAGRAGADQDLHGVQGGLMSSRRSSRRGHVARPSPSGRRRRGAGRSGRATRRGCRALASCTTRSSSSGRWRSWSRSRSRPRPGSGRSATGSSTAQYKLVARLALPRRSSRARW